MPSKNIYLNDKNYERLSKEENQSELINELLNAHYGTNPEEVLNHVREIWKQRDEEVKASESRRDMIIRIYKKHHKGIEPDEEYIAKSMGSIERANNIDKEIKTGERFVPKTETIIEGSSPKLTHCPDDCNDKLGETCIGNPSSPECKLKKEQMTEMSKEQNAV